MIPPTRVLHETKSSPIDNVGLAHDKLAPLNATLGSSAQNEFLRRLASQGRVPPTYPKAFERWVRFTLPGEHAGLRRIVRTGTSQGRVLCGMGAPTPTENGLTLHAVHGTPILPGSSLKGIARAWCHRVLHDDPEWGPGGTSFHVMFGRAPGKGREEGGESGVLRFLDALWVPGGQAPWAAEILTPHHSHYYRGDRPPDGIEGPNPVTFLAAQGTFRFVIEGPEGWVERGAEILALALAEQGVGAKSRAGYGRFVLTDELTEQDRRALEERERKRELADLERGLNAAELPERVELLAGLHATPAGWLQAALQWLKGEPTGEPFLDRYPLQEAMALAVYNQLYRAGLAKGLVSKLADTAHGPAIRAHTDKMRGSSRPGPRPTGFGSAHEAPASFPAVGNNKKGKKARAKFVKRIAAGGYDEATVHAALAHLESAKAPEGAKNQIRRAYGLPTT